MSSNAATCSFDIHVLENSAGTLGGLSCHDKVNLSLREDCTYEISPQDVLKTAGCINKYSIRINYPQGTNSYDPPVTLDYTHRQREHLTYTLTNELTGNTCWGYLWVEDKWAPLINCEDDTLNCWDAEEFLAATPEDDNCGFGLQFEEKHRIWVDFECEHPDFIGYVQRSVISKDVWGNVSRCDSQRIYIIRENLDDLVCPADLIEIECCREVFDPEVGAGVPFLWHPDYAYEDEDGYSHPIPRPGDLVEPPYLLRDPLSPHYLIPGKTNYGKCQIVSDYKDHIIPTCGSSYKIRREWKIFDWCTGEDTLCIQWIKIQDNLPPAVEQPFLTSKAVCLDGSNPLDSPYCQTVKAFDISPYETVTFYDEIEDTTLTSIVRRPRTYYVKPHECKSHVTIYRPKIMDECGF